MAWTNPGDFMFGKDSSANTSQYGTLTPEQQAALKKLLEGLGSGAGGEAYGGPLVADQNKVQGASLSAMEQYAMNSVGEGSAYGKSSKAYEDIMNQKPQDLTDYFQKSIVDPAMQNFSQNIMPELTRRFKGNAGYGSDRIMQEGIAAGNTATGVASAMSEASRQALSEQQRNKLAAAQGLTGTRSAQLTDLLGIQQGGANARAQDQLSVTANYQEFQRQQAEKNQRIQQLLAALGIKGVENVTTVTPGQPGFLQGISSGIGSGLGQAAGGLMFSDRSMKTNIKRIGTHSSGIGIYSFDYVWGTSSVGVMADEVRKVRPDAVTTHKSGYDMVDYSKL